MTQSQRSADRAAAAADPLTDAMRARRHREIMAAFGCQALRGDDLDALLTDACRRVAEGLQVERAKVLQYRAETDDLLIRAGVGWHEDVVGRVHLPADMASPPGRAYRTGDAVFIEDIRRDDQNEFRYSDLLREHGVVALVNVPIRLDDFVFGVLEADSTEPRRFADDDRNFLLGFANLLAAAIHRQRADAAAREAAAERERLVEELRRAKEAAEEAVRAKGRYLAATGHDLKQPLQSILLCLDLVEARIADPDVRRQVARAQRGAERLSRVLDRLLQAARLEAGTLVLRRESVAVGQVLGAAADEVQLAAEEKGVDLRVVRSSARVTSDRDLLEHILQNFVGNALKYTEPGGRVLVGCRRRGDRLRLAVYDTGIGIPPDQHEAIFEEFRRLEPARGQGIGLGLAIVKRMAELLGHPLVVRSEVGRGSCFAIEVPIADA